MATSFPLTNYSSHCGCSSDCTFVYGRRKIAANVWSPRAASKLQRLMQQIYKFYNILIFAQWLEYRCQKRTQYAWLSANSANQPVECNALFHTYSMKMSSMSARNVCRLPAQNNEQLQTTHSAIHSTLTMPHNDSMDPIAQFDMHVSARHSVNALLTDETFE